jgi:nucleotide-binding universal stress UspA family protein
MKNVLLLVHDDTGQEARLQAALDLVRALDGHLSCLDVSVVPTMIDDFVPAGGAAMMADEERRAQGNHAKLDARLRAEDVRYDWRTASGDLVSCLCEASGLADVIVINRQLDGLPKPDMRAIAGALVRATDKPLIAVPERARSFAVGGHAMVAWDGSAPSMHALQAAVPLLERAGEVTIVAVDNGSIQTRASEAAEYLSRHGVKPVVRRLADTGVAAGAVLLDEIRILEADYVVMGGYGHSPLREAVFGGVTRRMLTESPVPLFLAHRAG